MKAWGRLTLQSGKPRMDVNVSGSIIYYTPFENNDFSELSISVSSILAGNLYDIYLNAAGNALLLTTAWSNNSTPSVARTQSGGLYFDASNNLYLGTVYAGSNGIVNWQVRPAPAQFGTNNDLGVFNAYNRLPFSALCVDTTSTWEYASSGYNMANNSDRNRINWVDGIGNVVCEGEFSTSCSENQNQAAALSIGVGLDQTAYPINWGNCFLQQAAMLTTNVGIPLTGRNWTNGLIGRHCWQAIVQATSVPITMYGNNFMILSAKLSV